MRKIALALLVWLTSFLNGQSQTGTTHWWNDAVFYELFVRSFSDADSNGIGDFKGIIQHLDYLNDGNPNTHDDLGINAIWLMPIQPSPSYHGYDITNYRDVNPAYGSRQDFRNFIQAAHSRGIKVIIDFVMNHCSRVHPWFQASAVHDTLYRDFFRWSTTNPGYNGPWGQQVWQPFPTAGGYFYGLFGSGTPDLNYAKPAVKDSMFEAARFWLDSMHVDGFRLDAAKYIFEDGSILQNTPSTLSFWHDFNTLYKGINPQAMTVGEVWDVTSTILPYVNNDKIDFCFEFNLASSILDAVNTGATTNLRTEIQSVYNQYPYLQFGTFLTNHDQDRTLDALGNNITKAKAAAAIYLTLPGIPFVYYGEEIGMRGQGSDQNKRAPMQWSNGPHAGFSAVTPWENIGSNAGAYNVSLEQPDSFSLLNWYKKLIRIRSQEIAMRQGEYKVLPCGTASVLSFVRELGSDKLVVIINTSTQGNYNLSVSTGNSSLTAGWFDFTDLITGNTTYDVHIDSLGQIHGLGTAGNQTAIYRLSVSTGVHRLPSFAHLTVYPNPGRGVFTVKADQAVRVTGVYLYDVLGQSITVDEWAVSNANEIKVNIHHLAAGMYQLKLVTEQGEMTTPVVAE